MNEYGDYSGKCNNQLLQFNPDEKAWINLKCFGTVPEPRSFHAAPTFVDKTWLFGGISYTKVLDDLYELDIPSVTWRKIRSHYTPRGHGYGSLTVATDFHLVLIGFQTELSNETFIMDLQSQSWRKQSSCDKVCVEIRNLLQSCLRFLLLRHRHVC